MKNKIPTTSPPTAIGQRIQALLTSLHRGLYEREEVMAMALLATLAEESIFLLGPPGVAKSMIARRLKYAFRDGRSFEYLMNRFSTPDEVFGPVSISRLRLEDKYERQTEHYLPGAQIVFLDEIWKAGPAIQNALLTVINEKVYRNGEQETPVELRGLIAASNELPEKGQGLEALWDRFLLRLEVQNIQDEDLSFRMIAAPDTLAADPVPEEAKISREELLDWSAQIDRVEVPEQVLSIIGRIRRAIPDFPGEGNTTHTISDRRWKKIVRLLRTAAFTQGRGAVEPIDCYLIAHCLWDKSYPYEGLLTRMYFEISEQLTGLDAMAFFAEKHKLDQEIARHTMHKEAIAETHLKTHHLPDGSSNFLIRLADGTHYFILEADYNRLEFGRPIPIDLSYKYKDEIRVFSKAIVQRSGKLFRVAIGDLDGILDTYDSSREVEIYVRPDEATLQMLRERIEALSKKTEEACAQVQSATSTLMRAILEYPYLKFQRSMKEPLDYKLQTLNDLSLRIRQAYHALDPSESNAEKPETA